MRDDLVIFDFDGTLADTWRDIEAAVRRSLREVGCAPVDPAVVRDAIGHGVRPLLQRAAGEAGQLDRLYEAFRRHYAACCLETTALYPGMGAVLDRLGGATLAVLSNKPQAFLDRIVAGLGLAGRFAVVVGGDALAVQKPDPATIAHVVARAGATRRVWMVGDSAIDVATGRAWGAATIGCAWGLRPVEELRAAGAQVIVAHPAELEHVLAAARR